jgi:hypothetical protein
MVWYVLLQPLRPELDVNKKNRVRNRESESMATLTTTIIYDLATKMYINFSTFSV